MGQQTAPALAEVGWGGRDWLIRAPGNVDIVSKLICSLARAKHHRLKTVGHSKIFQGPGGGTENPKPGGALPTAEARCRPHCCLGLSVLRHGADPQIRTAVGLLTLPVVGKSQ